MQINLTKVVTTAVAIAFLRFTSLALAQEEYTSKLESQEILEVALEGKGQNLIVDFDDAGIERSIAGRRVALHGDMEARRAKARELRKSAELVDVDEAREDDNLLQTLENQLDAIKDSVLKADSSGRINKVRNFRHISAAVLWVPDKAALDALLRNPTVKLIHPVKASRLQANWPASYSDIKLVHSDIRNGVAGHKGAGTRIVVLDTGPYLGAVPGWDDSRDGCIAYNTAIPGLAGFTQSWLANGGTSISANCRIWSLYDVTGSGICGAPVTANGAMQTECYNSAWQHATVIDDVIARVAPSAYITNIQIYDRQGNNTTADSLAGFDWVIKNHLQSPRIVAVNYSSEVSGSRYVSACPQSVFASRVNTLLSYNILTIVGTGNSAYKNAVSDPACVPGVVSVGAVTDSNVVAGSYGVCSDPALSADQVPCFSNTNTTLTSMLAPGVLIGPTSPAIPGDPGSILLAAGTSVAAPHVAAAIAILEGTDAFGTSKTASLIKSMLTTSGTDVTDRSNLAVVKKRLDIAAALGSTAPPTLATMLANVNSVSVTAGLSTSVTVSGFDQFGKPITIESLSFGWSQPQIAEVQSGTAINQPKIVGVSAGSSTLMISSGSIHTSVFVTVTSKVSTGRPDCKTNPASCS